MLYNNEPTQTLSLEHYWLEGKNMKYKLSPTTRTKSSSISIFSKILSKVTIKILLHMRDLYKKRF